jgi:hypothetical protein
MIIAATVLTACGLDPLTGDDSPDKNKIAMAYTYRFGNSNTYVSIDYKDSRRSINIMKLRGVVPISFKWETDKELIVYVPSKSLIVRTYKDSVDGITIKVQEESSSSLHSGTRF